MNVLVLAQVPERAVQADSSLGVARASYVPGAFGFGFLMSEEGFFKNPFLKKNLFCFFKNLFIEKTLFCFLKTHFLKKNSSAFLKTQKAEGLRRSVLQGSLPRSFG